MIDLQKASRKSWQILLPYWKRSNPWSSFGLLGAVVSLDLAMVAFAVYFTDIRKIIYDGLEKYDASMFQEGLWKFGAAAAVYICIAIYKLYLRQKLEMDWRVWTTGAALEAWLSPNVLARMELSGQADNPDQRVSDDVGSLCSLTLNLGLGLLSSVVTFASFFGMLWAYSGPLVFDAFGSRWSIPGYMALAAIAYAAIGSWINHLLGRAMIGVEAEQQRREANLRFSLMRARENAEAIGLLGGEEAERRRGSALLAAIRENWTRIMGINKRLTGFSVGYSTLSNLFPLIVASPRYFSKQISLGELMQISSAFGEVQGALSWFIGSYSSWVSWKAASKRLRGFFEQAHNANNQKGAAIATSEDGRMEAALSICLPDGSSLIPDVQFGLAPGQWASLEGPSGAGKSSIFKTISGLWPHVQGAASLPPDAFFIPQKPFIPAGGLMAALSYPAPEGAFSVQAARDALEACSLGHLAPLLDEAPENWRLSISGGEAQRIGFARALLRKPSALLLDEATSNQDRQTEKALLSAMREKLPGSCAIVASHREVDLRPGDLRLSVDFSSQGALGPRIWGARKI